MNAVTTAHEVLSGLARARYDLGAWLRGRGLTLEWAGETVQA